MLKFLHNIFDLKPLTGVEKSTIIKLAEASIKTNKDLKLCLEEEMILIISFLRVTYDNVDEVIKEHDTIGVLLDKLSGSKLATILNAGVGDICKQIGEINKKYAFLLNIYTASKRYLNPDIMELYNGLSKHNETIRDMFLHMVHKHGYTTDCDNINKINYTRCKKSQIISTNNIIELINSK